MNPVYVIQEDIVKAIEHCIDRSKTFPEVKVELERLQTRIKALKLVRDRYACSTLIHTMYCNILMRKLCLAYEYEGKLYTTANEVPGHQNTNYLHSLKLNSSQWDKLPQVHVWIHSGKVFDGVPVLKK